MMLIKNWFFIVSFHLVRRSGVSIWLIDLIGSIFWGSIRGGCDLATVEKSLHGVVHCTHEGGVVNRRLRSYTHDIIFILIMIPSPTKRYKIDIKINNYSRTIEANRIEFVHNLQDKIKREQKWNLTQWNETKRTKSVWNFPKEKRKEIIICETLHISSFNLAILCS